MLSAIITAQGYKVIEAATGSVGLQLARENHPALIVMDVRLPDISGLQITRLLKADANTADIPIIGTSAHAAAGDEDTLQAGCDAFMPKPLLITAFIGILHSLISHGPAAGNAAGEANASNQRKPEPARK